MRGLGLVLLAPAPPAHREKEDGVPKSTGPRVTEGKRVKAKELRLRTRQGRRELVSSVLTGYSAWARPWAHCCY